MAAILSRGDELMLYSPLKQIYSCNRGNIPIAVLGMKHFADLHTGTFWPS